MIRMGRILLFLLLWKIADNMLFTNENKQKLSNLEKRWDEIVYDLIDYPSVEPILKNFSQNFIAQMSFISENFIQEILIIK